LVDTGGALLPPTGAISGRESRLFSRCGAFSSFPVDRAGFAAAFARAPFPGADRAFSTNCGAISGLLISNGVSVGQTASWKKDSAATNPTLDSDARTALATAAVSAASTDSDTWRSPKTVAGSGEQI